MRKHVRAIHIIAGLILACSTIVNANAGDSPKPSPSATPLFTREDHHYVLDKPMETSGRVTDGLRFSLTPHEVRSQFGKPVNLDLWFNIVGQKPIPFCFANFHDNLSFAVIGQFPARGTPLTPPFNQREIQQEMRCVLTSNEQLHYTVPLTSYISIPGPGTYRVTAILRASWHHYQPLTPLQSNPITWVVTP